MSVVKGKQLLPVWHCLFNTLYWSNNVIGKQTWFSSSEYFDHILLCRNMLMAVHEQNWHSPNSSSETSSRPSSPVCGTTWQQTCCCAVERAKPCTWRAILPHKAGHWQPVKHQLGLWVSFRTNFSTSFVYQGEAEEITVFLQFRKHSSILATGEWASIAYWIATPVRCSKGFFFKSC